VTTTAGRREFDIHPDYATRTEVAEIIAGLDTLR
jgi:hypothetical protein